MAGPKKNNATYLWALVGFSSRNNHSCQFDVMGLEIVQNFLAMDVVDSFVNHGKTTIVTFWMNTGRIQKLWIARIK